MAVVILREKPNREELARIAEEFEDYVKIVVDIKKNIIAAGGKLHTDGESLLLKDGSHQKDLWGGGVDLISKQIDCTAIINIRPKQKNNSMEILDSSLREIFFRIVKKIFEGYEE